MNLHWIDWLIVVSLLGFICVSAYMTKQYMRSVADFLSANRCAGKYLLGVADGIVEADGEVIYQVKDMKVALSES